MKHIILVIIIMLSLSATGQAPLADELVQIHPVTTTEMNAITTPVDGSLVYNTTENTIYQRANNAWVPFSTNTSVYTGFFIIDNTTLTTTGTYVQTIDTLPFEPSQITFAAHPNVGSFNLNDDNATGNNNTNLLENTHGTMNGFARSDGSISQAVIFVGAHGNSVNDISRYANNSQCIGLRYTTQNGDNNGVISASLTSFNTDGFTLDVTFTLGTTGNTAQRDDILDESVIVMFTAYK